MLTPGQSPDTFDVDFARVPRPRSTMDRILDLARPATTVRVDVFAIGQVVAAALDTCDFLGVEGRPLVWNEYALFLSRPDHDRLQALEEDLHKKVLQMLNTRMVARGADSAGPLAVRLLIDDENRIPSGRGVLRVRHTRDVAAIRALPGEITLRADRPATRASDGTDRVLGLRVEAPGGTVPLPEGERVVLGRPDPDAAPDHLAIPGASTKISRRHVALRVDGAHVEVTREPNANPVSVGASVLAAGNTVRVPLPANLTLSGELALVVRRP